MEAEAITQLSISPRMYPLQGAVDDTTLRRRIDTVSF